MKKVAILALAALLGFGFLVACGGGGGGGSESGAATSRPALKVIVDARTAGGGGEAPFATGALVHLQMQMAGKVIARDAVMGTKPTEFNFYDKDLTGTMATITITVNYKGHVKTQTKIARKPEHSVYFGFLF